MAAPNSLAEALESAAGQTGSSQATETPQGTEGQAAAQPTPPAEGQGGELIGLPKDQPDAGQQPPSQDSGKIELAVAPDTIVGNLDGKPVTAQEIQQGYLRTADYTRKTQELAAQRAEFQPYVEFIEANHSYLEDFVSGDPGRVKAAILEIAENFGVDLGSRPRTPDGRFASPTSGQQPSGLFDLNDYVEGTPEYESARRANELIASQQQAIDALRAEITDFKGGLQSQMEQARTLETAQAIAQQYATSGMDGIDVDAAMKLVGQPKSVEDAMRLHHFEQILRHNARVLEQRFKAPPNEAKGASREPGSLAGKSLAQAFDERSF